MYIRFECLCACVYCAKCACLLMFTNSEGVTIVRDDSPGSEGGVQASQHPEHAEPAQMFPAFIHLQELSEIGVHYRDGATNSGGEFRRYVLKTDNLFFYTVYYLLMIGKNIYCDLLHLSFCQSSNFSLLFYLHTYYTNFSLTTSDMQMVWFYQLALSTVLVSWVHEHESY